MKEDGAEISYTSRVGIVKSLNKENLKRPQHQKQSRKNQEKQKCKAHVNSSEHAT